MSSRDIRQKARPHCSHHYSGSSEEATGGSFTKIGDLLDEISSNIRLEHASKEVRPETASAHFRENDKNPQEALQSNGNAPGFRRTPIRYKTMIISHHVLILRRRGITLKESDSSAEPIQKHSIFSSYCSPHRRNPQARGISVRAD